MQALPTTKEAELKVALIESAAENQLQKTKRMFIIEKQQLRKRQPKQQQWKQLYHRAQEEQRHRRSIC